ncbi:MAG: hypothetical protein AAB685_01980 [Patescibacteria group bacterium]
MKVPFLKLSLYTTIANLIIIGAILVLLKRLPPEIPLFYGRPESERELAKSIFLIIPPTLSIVITIINTSLVKIVKDDFIANVLLGLIVASLLFSTITVGKIIFLVGNL